MDRSLVLKALADETRMSILTLLLERNYCVRALARQSGITEAAVSQHLKVLRNAGLVQGEKKGHFTHYNVQREVLHDLAHEIEALATIERKACTREHGDRAGGEASKCHSHGKGACTAAQKEMCHGQGGSGGACSHHRRT